MALPGAYDTYRKNKVLTASPGELVLMLYEGAIKFCNIGIVSDRFFHRYSFKNGMPPLLDC